MRLTKVQAGIIHRWIDDDAIDMAKGIQTFDISFTEAKAYVDKMLLDLREFSRDDRRTGRTSSANPFEQAQDEIRSKRPKRTYNKRSDYW